ncbi:putative uncharacterized protein [Parabacteroides sp. CAG:409]|uniref:DUF2721 domain-containing protein n=1 Tax=Parabacteroides faecalis TaxID=2924040 RepID=A0ABT0C5S6_9BACT|nr:DUF2721 domain-containing protein [Parabacteroides faecalis]MBS7342287.1 DUF2721 domain-containing protein [Parabacteroides sp.]MCJ2382364.1 DUF2721 domain-containing protein [Parabacteroides faecalis]CDE62394.1 putative uncharacterized protein [Parabacteroides sp. CAG:409]HIX21779.1 DUF2721 domain-containing protein [Candidatus Parabacteroides faecavium]
MLDLTTPSLLFSAISLILLAYTNRFLAYANVVRSLKDKYQQSGNPQDIEQIKNLRKRLSLTQSMQILGIASLLLCVVAMFSIYINLPELAIYLFGSALVLLAASLGVCIWEINISVKALDIHLKDMSSKQKLKT